MSITAEVVRQLREETGAGMMDCKSALVEAEGDMEKAREVLRKKGLAAAAKKASRTASEGATFAHIADGGRMGVLVEVNCETDFVAKTPDFLSLVKEVAANVAAGSAADVTALLGQPLAGDPGRTVGHLVQEKVAFIKENIVVRRFARFELPAGEAGLVAAYIHPPAAKVGVLVELAAKSADAAALAALAKDVAMHAAAASPAAALYVSRDEVPADVLGKEKEIYRAQALASGKPAGVVDKIAEGKMKEYYATYCLLEQPYIREPKVTLGQHLDGKAVVRRFVRYRLGEESGTKAESSRADAVPSTASGLAGKLQVGMKLAEITGILGEPTHTMQGGAALGMFGSVTGSPIAISSLANKVYCIWQRSEGEWKLVFSDGRLESIYSVPPPADFDDVQERERLAKAETKPGMKPDEIRALYRKYGLTSL